MTSPTASPGDGSAKSAGADGGTDPQLGRGHQDEKPVVEQEEREDQQRAEDQREERRREEEGRHEPEPRAKGGYSGGDLVTRGVKELAEELVDFAKVVKDAFSRREFHGDPPSGDTRLSGAENVSGEPPPSYESVVNNPLGDRVPAGGSGDELPGYEAAINDPPPNYFTPDRAPEPGRNGFGQSFHLASEREFQGYHSAFTTTDAAALRAHPGSPRPAAVNNDNRGDFRLAQAARLSSVNRLDVSGSEMFPKASHPSMPTVSIKSTGVEQGRS